MALSEQSESTGKTLDRMSSVSYDSAGNAVPNRPRSRPHLPGQVFTIPNSSRAARSRAVTPAGAAFKGDCGAERSLAPAPTPG